MRIGLATLLATLFVGASHADEWVRLDQSPAQPAGRRLETYIDRASIALDGASLTFDQIVVGRGDTAYRPLVHGSRIAFNCEWGTVHYGVRPSSVTPASPMPPPAPRESFANVDLLGVAMPLCAGAVPEGDALTTEGAMLDDAARRLGGGDWASASRLPPEPQFIRPATPGPAAKPLPEQRFGIAFPASDNRAVLLLIDSLKRDDGAVSGTSIWVANVGMKPAPYEHQVRAYNRRIFAADCGAGTIALEVVAIAPGESMGDHVARLPDAPQATPRPGSSSAALWAAACTDAPIQQLASAAEFYAYVEAPEEDPAFRARRTTRYPYDQVRWVQTPSPEDLAASLEQSGADLADLKWTSIWCAVTRDYKLTDCQTATNTRFHEELENSHLALADRYVPAHATVAGEDIAGRTVEATIEWRAGAARLKPLTYEQSELAWKRAPAEAEILRARIVKAPSEVTLRCTISPAYELVDCSAPTLSTKGSSLSVVFHDLVMNGQEKTEQRTQLARAVRDRILPLLSQFKPPHMTARGEPTAGQYVKMAFVWK